MEIVRIYEIPDCKMVSSGPGMFGEEKFGRFFEWFHSLPAQIFPRDYLLWDDETQKHIWLYLYENGLNVPDEFEIIDFKGGLYAVSTDIDQQTDMEAMKKEKEAFFETHRLEVDSSRPELGNIFTTPLAEEVLGYYQMDYYTPVKPK